MATEQHRETDADRRRRFALQNEIVALTATAQSVCLLSVADAATLLDKSSRTLRRARIERDESLASERPIDPASLASVAFVPPAVGESEVHYSVSELLNYQKRRVAAARAAVLADDDTAVVPEVARGFQSWLANAGPEADSAWPFSIQPGGRPVDLFEAIQTDKLTGKSERLAMRQFLREARRRGLGPGGFLGTGGIERHDAAIRKTGERDASSQPFARGAVTSRPSKRGTRPRRAQPGALRGRRAAGWASPPREREALRIRP